MSTAANADWHTILVGGLGKGGKGFYALDITEAFPQRSMPRAAPARLNRRWPRGKCCGNSLLRTWAIPYGAPLIAKTRKYGWVVLLTSGYNNRYGQRPPLCHQREDRRFARDTKHDRGLCQLTQWLDSGHRIYKGSHRQQPIEQVYAGDLLGNVWRFDLSGTGTYPAPTLLAQLTDPSGNPQPVTTAPRIELDLASNSLENHAALGICGHRPGA